MERFIKEYANYQMKNYKQNTLMQKKYKDEKISKINKALAMREKGFITVDEAIKVILDEIWKRLISKRNWIPKNEVI